MNRQKILIGSAIGCGALLVVGALLAVAAVIGANIGTQKAKEQGTADEGEMTNTPKGERGEEEYIPVVMEVSGEGGTRYNCNYSGTSSEGYPIREEEQGELGASPVEYRARVREDSGFYGYCSIDNPEGRGWLKLELLVDGHVVDSAETQPDPPGLESARSSFVDVSYSP